MTDTPGTAPDLSVRLAAPFDSIAIARLQVRSWQAAYRDLMPAAFLDALSADTRAEQWHTILREATHDERTWVGIHNGTVSGFASAGPTRDGRLELRTGEVYALYLLPEALGSGLGRLLLEAASSWLADRRHTQATLWTLAANARACRFFEREGWTRDDIEMPVSYGGERLIEVRYRRRFLAG